MNTVHEAKFNLLFGSIEDYIEDNYIDTNLIPDLIEVELDELLENMGDYIIEYVKDVYSDVDWGENETPLHPETGEELWWETYEDMWMDEQEDVINRLTESFSEIIVSQLPVDDDTKETFAGEVEEFIITYLEDVLRDEWSNLKK
jgi:hypothetical protein